MFNFETQLKLCPHKFTSPPYGKLTQEKRRDFCAPSKHFVLGIPASCWELYQFISRQKMLPLALLLTLQMPSELDLLVLKRRRYVCITKMQGSRQAVGNLWRRKTRRCAFPACLNKLGRLKLRHVWKMHFQECFT